MSKLANMLRCIQTGIVSTAGVGAGQVHTTRRWFHDPTSWQKAFWDATLQRMHGWYITRTASPEEDTDTVRGMCRRVHVFQIVGVYQVEDVQTGTACKSEATFQALVEAVCDKLRRDHTLGGFAEQSSQPLVTRIDTTDVAGTLCHLAEISLSAIERISIT